MINSSIDILAKKMEEKILEMDCGDDKDMLYKFGYGEAKTEFIGLLKRGLSELIEGAGLVIETKKELFK